MTRPTEPASKQKRWMSLLLIRLFKRETKVPNNSQKGGAQERPRQVYGQTMLKTDRAKSRGDAGLMEGMEDRTMKQSCLPPFPPPLEIVAQGLEVPE